MQAQQTLSVPIPARRSLTLTEAAAILGVSTQTLTRAIGRGELKTVQIGARHRVPTAELERLLSTSTEPAA